MRPRHSVTFFGLCSGLIYSFMEILYKWITAQLLSVFLEVLAGCNENLPSPCQAGTALRGGLARGIFGHGLTFQRLSAGYKFLDLVLVVVFLPKPLNSLTGPLLKDFHQFTIYQVRLHPRNEKIGLQKSHPIPILGGPPCFNSRRDLVFRMKYLRVSTSLVDAQPSGTLERPLA